MIRLYSRLAAALLICGLPVLPTPAAAMVITLITEDYPPFNTSQSGKISGISVDLLREAFRRAGVRYEIKMLPWQRAYHMAETQTDTCVFSTARTPEREAAFKWIGPLADNDWVLFARADSHISLASLDDAKPYTIGGYLGDAAGTYLAQRGFKVFNADQDRLNVKMLASGRIDLWATGRLVGPYWAAAEGGPSLKPLLTFHEAKLFLACNASVPDQTVAQLNAALEDMSKDGTRATLGAPYL